MCQSRCHATHPLHHCEVRKLRRTIGVHPAAMLVEMGDIECDSDVEEWSEEADEDGWSSSEGEEDDEESSHFEGCDTERQLDIKRRRRGGGGR